MQDLKSIAPELDKDVRAAAATVHASDDVLIVSHIDADGISSAAIAYTACIRSKIGRFMDNLRSSADGSIPESDLQYVEREPQFGLCGILGPRVAIVVRDVMVGDEQLVLTELSLVTAPQVTYPDERGCILLDLPYGLGIHLLGEEHADLFLRFLPCEVLHYPARSDKTFCDGFEIFASVFKESSGGLDDT